MYIWQFAFVGALCRTLCSNTASRTRLTGLCRHWAAHKLAHKVTHTRYAQGDTRYTQGCAQVPPQPCARVGRTQG